MFNSYLSPKIVKFWPKISTENAQQCNSCIVNRQIRVGESKYYIFDLEFWPLFPISLQISQVLQYKY